MKPSHAKMLQNADLIFWVGEDLESFLEKPLSSIAKKAEKKRDKELFPDDVLAGMRRFNRGGKVK